MGRHYPGNPRSHLSGRFVHAIPQTRRPDISYHSLNSHGRCRDAAAAPLRTGLPYERSGLCHRIAIGTSASHIRQPKCYI